MFPPPDKNPLPLFLFVCIPKHTIKSQTYKYSTRKHYFPWRNGNGAPRKWSKRGFKSIDLAYLEYCRDRFKTFRFYLLPTYINRSIRTNNMSDRYNELNKFYKLKIERCPPLLNLAGNKKIVIRIN